MYPESCDDYVYDDYVLSSSDSVVQLLIGS